MSSSCYTALLSLKKTAKLPKRCLSLSLKKSRFADVHIPVETTASLACYSMPEKVHVNTVATVTAQGVNVLITSSGHVSNIKRIYQLSGYV